ncbi:MAG: cell division protein SepF [Actinomycetia bacterium]|nr:cell division protein SepF [Actinomycetes bacterium]MCP5034354.1 cell division protein SepF [Actinomycetes bacterium]
MSMLRSVLTYMGLGPDEDYDDGYLYDVDDSGGDDEARLEEDHSDDSSQDPTIDVRDDEDPHSQRRRPDWLAAPTQGSTPGGRHRPTRESRSPRPRWDSSDRESVRPLRAVPPADFDPADDGITVRSVPPNSTEPEREDGPDSFSGGPRYVKPRALSLQTFGEAKVLADEFKNGVPVIMNLQGVERDLARRLIDFASGICYALDGGMEKIASQVFLLTPSSVEVSAEDRQRMEQRGYE